MRSVLYTQRERVNGHRHVDGDSISAVGKLGFRGTDHMADLTPHIAVSQRLVLLRQFHADSAADFCRKAGFAPSAWNNYETGDRRISVDAAIQLCNHFRITLDWIYRGELYGLPAEFVDYLRSAGASGKIHAAWIFSLTAYTGRV